MTLVAVLVVVSAYLLGSIPFSYLVARRWGVADVRKEGSGNVGATNVMRSAGKAAGITAFVLDFAKGLGASWSAVVLGGDATYGLLAAAAAVVGHMYPVWLSFKGGKGVATGAGAFLPLAPAAVGIAVVVFASTAAITRYVSLGSVAGALALVAGVFLLGNAPLVSWGALGVASLIVFKHRGNLARIARGSENRLGKKAEET
jgi:glycerol-3-phosphate acyltransferase PlsY